MTEQTEAQTQDSHQPEQDEPAPKSKTGGVAGGEVVPSKEQSKGGQQVPDKSFFIAKRLEKRAESVKSDNDALSQRLAALEAKLAAGSEGGGAETPNPDVSAKREADFAKRIAAQVKAELGQEQAVSRIQNAELEADKWLRSRSHLQQDSNLVPMIRRKLEEQALLAPIVNPISAAKAAYLDVCEELGVEPDLARQSPTGSSGSGVRPSSAGKGGSAGEVTLETIRALDPKAPDYKEKRAQVQKAIEEGRRKGVAAR